jgi:TRAP-type C4-dicarboxylate transport system permease small subunit
VWIPLNTNIPFLGNCIGKSDGSTSNTAALTAFPTIIQAVSRMLVTVILLFGFIMIIVGWVKWASWDAKSGMEMIKKVWYGIAALGLIGVILRFVDPNFFK